MRHRQGTAPVPSRIVERIAAEADVAVETVRRAIYGRPVRPRMARRIRAAMERRGLGGVLTETGATAAPPVHVTQPARAAAPAETLLPCAHLARRYREFRRQHRPDEMGPRGIGMRPLTRDEQQELAADEAALLAAGVSLQRPRTLAECPPADQSCPWVSCRHHLYLEVDPDLGFIKLNFPERDVDELEETCSLRVAGRTPAVDLSLEKGARRLSEVWAFLNITPERANQLAQSALVRVRAALEAATGVR